MPIEGIEILIEDDEPKIGESKRPIRSKSFKDTKNAVCAITMISRVEPSHTHICGGNHAIEKSHKCTETGCGKHFWKRGEHA